jgi:predicted nucleic-acid-binding protein
MIAVDTNVVVRFLTADDPPQAKKSRALFRDHEVWLSRTVILETEWVLRAAYELDRTAINKALTYLIQMEGIEVEDPILVSKALNLHATGWDLADALHVVVCPPETKTFYSFDRRLIKKNITELKLAAP